MENGHLNLMRGLSKGGDRGYLSRHFGHDDTADDLIYDYGNENARGSVANACEPIKEILADLQDTIRDHSPIKVERGLNEILTLHISQTWIAIFIPMATTDRLETFMHPYQLVLLRSLKFE